MPKVGIEPTRGHPRWILSPVRLPISPLRLKRFGSIAERTIEVKGEIEVINDEKNVDTQIPLCYKHVSLDGAVAQLGERLNGIQEVRGSIPRSSTIKEITGTWRISPSAFFFAQILLYLRRALSPSPASTLHLTVQRLSQLLRLSRVVG